MSTEIAPRDDHQAVAVPATHQPEPSALMKWAEEAKVISNLAVSIAKTSFAGQLRNQPEEVTAVILAGHELGLKPMASLKAMDIIQGTPALRAHAMRGLVMSKGHEVELVESSEDYCRMRGRRQGGERWQEVEWPIARAAKLGLVGKPEWKKQPQTMLVARATGEICRLIASDVLHGVPYTTEELEDSTVIRGEAAVARPRMSVAALTAAPPAPAEQAPAAAVTAPEYGVDRDDQQDDEGDGSWRQTPDSEPAGWPTVTQPGGAE